MVFVQDLGRLALRFNDHLRARDGVLLDHWLHRQRRQLRVLSAHAGASRPARHWIWALGRSGGVGAEQAGTRGKCTLMHLQQEKKK